MISCWATFIAILSHVWPTGLQLYVPGGITKWCVRRGFLTGIQTPVASAFLPKQVLEFSSPQTVWGQTQSLLKLRPWIKIPRLCSSRQCQSVFLQIFHFNFKTILALYNGHQERSIVLLHKEYSKRAAIQFSFAQLSSCNSPDLCFASSIVGWYRKTLTRRCASLGPRCVSWCSFQSLIKFHNALASVSWRVASHLPKWRLEQCHV